MSATAPSQKRIAALRQYHATRPAKTREKLNEALDRMLAGTPVILDPKKLKLNKAGLAKEAGVSIHTLLKRESNGTLRFRDVLASLESCQRKKPVLRQTDDERDQKIAELRSMVVELKEDKLKLALELDRTALQLLKTNQEMVELRQDHNEQLQELLALRNRVVAHATRVQPRRKR